jgi:hypothetical protein
MISKKGLSKYKNEERKLIKDLDEKVTNVDEKFSKEI